jgi:hypothetical protein
MSEAKYILLEHSLYKLFDYKENYVSLPICLILWISKIKEQMIPTKKKQKGKKHCKKSSDDEKQSTFH